MVETAGGGGETDPDLEVLIEGRVCEPVEIVDGVPLGGVTVETEVDKVVIVDPNEFVVMYGTIDVESNGPDLGHV